MPLPIEPRVRAAPSGLGRNRRRRGACALLLGAAGTLLSLSPAASAVPQGTAGDAAQGGAPAGTGAAQGGAPDAGAQPGEPRSPRRDFRADLQLARRALAEFEHSRANLLEPRAFEDPLLGWIAAPGPGVAALELEASDPASDGAWQPRLRLGFRPDGRLDSATAWDGFGACLGTTRWIYGPDGALLEQRREAEPGRAEPLGSLRFERAGDSVRVLFSGAGEPRTESELVDGAGRLLERQALEADGTRVEWRAERAPDGALLAIHERRGEAAPRPILSARALPPLTELCCHHDGAAIPFQLRLAPSRPGETGFELELEPQGARLLLIRADDRPASPRGASPERSEPGPHPASETPPGSQAAGTAGPEAARSGSNTESAPDPAAPPDDPAPDWQRLEMRLWQPPRRAGRPLFPRFEPAWLEQPGVDGPLAPAGATPLRLELGGAEPQPADGALRFVATEFRDGHWCEGRLERYGRSRRSFEPSGLRFRLSWSPMEPQTR